jgi:hypothetical protein
MDLGIVASMAQGGIPNHSLLSETTRKDPDVPLLEDGLGLWFPYSLKISVKLLGTNFTRHILR